MAKACLTHLLFTAFYTSIIWLSFPVNAQVPPPNYAPLEKRVNYQKCMRLARNSPDKGFEEALRWQDHGGADAARHCAAVALIHLRQFKEAAVRLEALAQNMPKSTPDAVRAEIFAHAGQAWLEANDPTHAFTLQSIAIKLNPQNAQLWVDRATTHASTGRYADAVEDLSESLKLRPGSAEAWTLRASAHRYAGNLAAARHDVVRAISIDPAHAGGLLESGILKRLAGDKDSARQEWLKLIELHEGSPAAETAKRNLEILDVNSQ
ncbi:tetratricopeptide repeat protein [Alphaproteobacteria bacterium]|jgi:tetratricopeptide (TPR) repeat protein|nr:tetratricopeptide repeat protein [Alphaproteobacteria bacterium]